jgi:hypothetical protein
MVPPTVGLQRCNPPPGGVMSRAQVGHGWYVSGQLATAMDMNEAVYLSWSGARVGTGHGHTKSIERVWQSRGSWVRVPSPPPLLPADIPLGASLLSPLLGQIASLLQT